MKRKVQYKTIPATSLLPFSPTPFFIAGSKNIFLNTAWCWILSAEGARETLQGEGASCSTPRLFHLLLQVLTNSCCQQSVGEMASGTHPHGVQRHSQEGFPVSLMHPPTTSQAQSTSTQKGYFLPVVLRLNSRYFLVAYQLQTRSGPGQAEKPPPDGLQPGPLKRRVNPSLGRGRAPSFTLSDGVRKKHTYCLSREEEPRKIFKSIARYEKLLH